MPRTSKATGKKKSISKRIMAHVAHRAAKERNEQTKKGSKR